MYLLGFLIYTRWLHLVQQFSLSENKGAKFGNAKVWRRRRKLYR
jgi:hypothetical protein